MAVSRSTQESLIENVSREIAREKGIKLEDTILALEQALLKAAVRSYGEEYHFVPQFDAVTKKIKLFNRIRIVSDEKFENMHFDDKKYLSMTDAIEEYELNDLIAVAKQRALDIFVSRDFSQLSEHFIVEDEIKIDCYLDIDPQELSLQGRKIEDFSQDEFEEFCEIVIHLPVYYQPAETRSVKNKMVRERFGNLIPTSEQKNDRIIASYAKHVFSETLKDIERDHIVKEFKDKVGQILEGTLRFSNRKGYQKDKNDYYVDLNGTEAILPVREQITDEFLPHNTFIRFLLLDVKSDQKGPQIIVSRKSEQFIVKLLEENVPEIFSGEVKIKAIAREAGVRTKIAVTSTDPHIDPIGACLGPQSSKIRNVLDEIGKYMPKNNNEKEKVEIILYQENLAEYVRNAIQPTSLSHVNVISRYIMNESKQKMSLVIPHDHLKQMIGKRGQNVRLASRLTGWNIDIFDENDYIKQENLLKEELSQEAGINPKHINDLWNHSVRNDYGIETFKTLEDISSLEVKELADYINIPEADADHIIQTARRLLDEKTSDKE
jgi:N utilization substance protein A